MDTYTKVEIVFKRVLTLVGLSPTYIEWKTRAKRESIKWRVTPEGKLLINKKDYSPKYTGYTKEWLEEHLTRMKQVIADSGHPIIILAYAVEFHVLTGLWNHGVVTCDQLQRAVPSTGDGVEFAIELSGELHRLRVCSCTYYDSYEFIVSGHPQGHVRVLDVPDVLALLGEGEEIF